MVISGLRELLNGPIVGLKDRGTHQQLAGFCESLGLPAPDGEGSKRDRMQASYDSAAEEDLPAVAERFLRVFPPDAAMRNRIQEMIWTQSGGPEIPKRFRRELANSLESERLYLSAKHFENLLDQLWVLDDDPFAAFLSDKPTGLRAEVDKHVFRNPGDWLVDTLFERLGAYDCSDRRFALFLEGLASADVRPDVPEQQHFVQVVNESLRSCGVEFQETGCDGGYPVFNLIPVGRHVRARPKNLIFASSCKPDLRFRDAISNDIEIVTNADKVLIYESPITAEGLRWKDLQT